MTKNHTVDPEEGFVTKSIVTPTLAGDLCEDHWPKNRFSG